MHSVLRPPVSRTGTITAVPGSGSAHCVSNVRTPDRYSTLRASAPTSASQPAAVSFSMARRVLMKWRPCMATPPWCVPELRGSFTPIAFGVGIKGVQDQPRPDVPDRQLVLVTQAGVVVDGPENGASMSSIACSTL
jgi:hypothetical protein